MLADAAAATDYVWNGANGADWATPGNWLVGGAEATTAPASTDTIRIDAPCTIAGTGVLTVTKIITACDSVTFECPVAFASTYNVVNAVMAPVFAGGATATIPDDSLTSANIPSHEFRGNVTLTADWTVPNLPAGNPYVVAPGARLNGKTITAAAYQSVNYHLRIDKDAVATFDTVDVKNLFVFKLNGGRLVATGAVNMWQNDCGQYLESNVGTVEANAIIKNDPGHANINFYITDMLVGSGGFGMFRRDYNLVFQRNSRLGASDGKDGDWGLNLNGYTFTINTAGYTVNFDSITRPTAGKIVKEGEGELVMQKFLKEHTGGTILNGGLTTVKRTGTLGYGTATVNSGATLRFTDAAVAQAYPIVVNSGATLANEVTVADTSTLTFAAGTTLKPTQNTFFDVTGGTLVLPGSGTVTVDMTDFAFVTGLANPVLAGEVHGARSGRHHGRVLRLERNPLLHGHLRRQHGGRPFLASGRRQHLVDVHRGVDERGGRAGHVLALRGRDGRRRGDDLASGRRGCEQRDGLGRRRRCNQRRGQAQRPRHDREEGRRHVHLQRDGRARRAADHRLERRLQGGRGPRGPCARRVGRHLADRRRGRRHVRHQLQHHPGQRRDALQGDARQARPHRGRRT